LFSIVVIIAASSLSQAQTTDRPVASDDPAAAPPLSVTLAGPGADFGLDQQPAGPPPTPRHTGIKAMARNIVTNFKYLPSKENLFWAATGGGLALIAHPFDDNVNESLVGSSAAENFFKAGEVLGELPTLLSSAAVVYAVGRIGDK